MNIPPSGPASSPQPAPQRGGLPSWLLWLLGGLLVLATLCGVAGLAGGFLLVRSAAQRPPAPAGGVAQAPGSAVGAPIYDVQADAKQDIAQALAAAKAQQKLVLIDFGADWCPDCVVLARIFESDQVKPYLDAHYVVVRVNVGEWDANLDVSRRYGDPIKKGIPAVVVLSPDGRTVASTGGGELANARSATRQEILGMLQGWAEQR